jgi:glycosyltransferase involved in cell wall biosynthesis
MQRPEISVLVSSYERPWHLQRSLLSIALQRDVEGLLEVVVTDDGSSDEVLAVVSGFAREVDFPVKFTTHPHEGFRLARCRNEGVAASAAPYLLFTDGDCVLPPDHVRWHLEFRRPGRVVVGDCYRLDRAATQRVTDRTIRSGAYLGEIPRSERRRLATKAFRAQCYHLLRLAMLPRLTGNNVGLWRSDFERVNGFDESYVGWGFEDRDLQRRLAQLGLRFKSILHRTATCHLWHPPAPSFARNGVGTKNLAYFGRRHVATRCAFGLAERMLEDEWNRCREPAVGAPRLVPPAESWPEEEATSPEILRLPTMAPGAARRRAA